MICDVSICALYRFGKSDISTNEREEIKRITYSILYGVGRETLADQLKTTTEEAQSIIQSFLGRYYSYRVYNNNHNL